VGAHVHLPGSGNPLHVRVSQRRGRWGRQVGCYMLFPFRRPIKYIGTVSYFSGTGRNIIRFHPCAKNRYEYGTLYRCYFLYEGGGREIRVTAVLQTAARLHQCALNSLLCHPCIKNQLTLTVYVCSVY
jgi:hypothetical protein